MIAKVKESVTELAEKTKRHDEFSKKMGDDNVVEWTKQLDEWEIDHAKLNPFESTCEGKAKFVVNLLSSTS